MIYFIKKFKVFFFNHKFNFIIKYYKKWIIYPVIFFI